MSLEGEASVVIPVTWQAIGYLIFGALVSTFAFLWLATYARVQVVSGVIQPDLGISTIVPSRNGVISSIAVQSGQDVRAGTVLAAIRSEEDTANALSVGAQIAKALEQQNLSLAEQMKENSEAASAQAHQLVAQQSGLAREIVQLQTQVSLQEGLVESSRNELERSRPIAARGFVSGTEMRQREELLISRQQNLAALKQAVASKRAALDQTARTQIQILAQAHSQNANTASLRAQVNQQLVSSSGSRAYVLRAPIAGRVASLTGRTGQPASPENPIMSIVPAGSKLRAELAVPSTAIGFIKPLQEVRLAIDAFPYERFGTIKGKVLTVASSAISQQGANGVNVFVYPVTVELAQTKIKAFGQKEALVPGMTVSARIIIEKQSLLQWLFEPLFAVQRR